MLLTSVYIDATIISDVGMNVNYFICTKQVKTTLRPFAREVFTNPKSDIPFRPEPDE